MAQEKTGDNEKKVIENAEATAQQATAASSTTKTAEQYSATRNTASNLTSTEEKQHSSIINAQFLQNNSYSSSEIVDVVTQYYWTYNKPKEINSGQISNVPFVYAIEYQQRFGVTLTNLLNNLYGLTNSGGNIVSNATTGIASILTKTSDTILSSLDSHEAAAGVRQGINNATNKITGVVNSATSTVGEWISKYGGYGGNTHLQTSLLKPYRFLYSLDKTGKMFCFPFFGENAGGWNLNNSFSADGSVSLLSKQITEGIEKLSNGLASVAGDVQDFANFMGPKSGYQKTFTMYNIEKAKAFSFPTDGKKITVSFPLFNTVAKDEWKKNYKFIVLFGTRNMLFRVNNVQYYQPMIYDVSTPGQGRMPLCYVSSFTVTPVGMTRVKSINMNFLKSYGNTDTSKITNSTTVIVPEAWIVKIEFQSLIAESANQFLSSVFDLPIKATLTGE